MLFFPFSGSLSPNSLSSIASYQSNRETTTFTLPVEMPLQRTKTVYTSLDSTLSCSPSARSNRFPLPVSVKDWTQTNTSSLDSSDSSSLRTSSAPSSLSDARRDSVDSCSTFSHSRPQVEHVDRHAYTCPQFSLELASCSILRPTEDGSIYFSPKHALSYPHGSGYGRAEECFPEFARGVTA